MTRDFPLASDELRAIADTVDAINSTLGPLFNRPGGDWVRGATVVVEDELGNPIGRVEAHPDEWFGFYPYAFKGGERT